MAPTFSLIEVTLELPNENTDIELICTSRFARPSRKMSGVSSTKLPSADDPAYLNKLRAVYFTAMIGIN